MDEMLQMLEGIRAELCRIGERLMLFEQTIRRSQSAAERTPESPPVAPVDRRIDPLCGLDAAHGLHCLKDRWVQIAYLPQQCQHLASGENFQSACAITRLAAPPRWRRNPRGRMLYLDPHPERLEPDQTMRESRLERAMFRRWGRSDSQYVEKAWHRLIKYQVPLKENRNSPAGLKAIDLLGVTAACIPVVIELKVMHASPETPLRAILEAAAYGCVLEAAWEPRFRQELADRLIEFSMSGTPPLQLNGCPLVIAAPSAYWNFWSEHEWMRAAASAFRNFLDKMRDRHFPVTFISIVASNTNWQDDLPRNWQELYAETIEFPPG
jgi:hypothetical protein